MPTDPSHPIQSPWPDVEGTPIAILCWVEQITEHGSPSSRPHRRGEVIGRGPDVLYVRFAGEGQRVVSVAPQLVRLLPDAPGKH